MSAKGQNLGGRDIPMNAAADLSARQYCWVKLGGTGLQDIDLCGASDDPIGVLQDKPSDTKPEARVRISGTTVVHAGAAITRGKYLVVGDAYGRVTMAVGETYYGAQQQIVGLALEAAAAADDEIVMLIRFL